MGLEPGAFNGIEVVTDLELSENSLELLPVNMFSNYNSCRIIGLASNGISEIESGSFNGLGSLERLNLDRNRLTALKAGMFQGAGSLIWLRLSNNRINTLEDDVFTNLTALKYLRLDGNDLTTLPADVFTHLARPLWLTLYYTFTLTPADNQLQCDAALCWLKQEELNGTVMWPYYYDYPDPILLTGVPYRVYVRPRCVSGIDWNTWVCDEIGDAFIICLIL